MAQAIPKPQTDVPTAAPAGLTATIHEATPGYQHTPTFISENTTGALVKLLIAAAEREDELFAELSKAVADNDQAATLSAARALVALRVTSSGAKRDNCGG